jgi:hypothetical protein
MRKLPLSPLAIALLFALAACKKSSLPITEAIGSPAQLSRSSQRVNDKSGTSVNGQAGITLNGRVQHFSFHASIDENGYVSGSWESKSPGQNFRSHGTITCLTLIDNQTAILSGTITHRSGEGYTFLHVGDLVWFKVKDNGEGKNAAPDQFSDYIIGPSACEDYENQYYSIENGNIQVRP